MNSNNLETLEQAKRTIVDLSIRYGPKAFVAVLILVVGFLVARWIGNLADRSIERWKFEPPIRTLMVRLVRLLVLGLFAILALQNLGVELLPLIAGLGVAGAGIALAMQGVLGNLVAGLTIIFTKPFRIGEYVSMAGEEGRVESIELFVTTLSHPDLSRVVIPNRKIVGEILHNYGQLRQLNVIVGVAYATDLNLAITAINDVLRRLPRVLKEPAPVIRVIETADSSINIAIKPWVNVPDYGAAVGEVNKAVVEEFRVRNITIPFPQRDVHVLSGAVA
jgi:small conductance mechanosensitive channel